MGTSTARYTAVPRRVNATVIDRLVECGIASSTVAIVMDARIYLKTRHLRAMAYLTTSIAELASKVIKAR